MTHRARMAKTSIPASKSARRIRTGPLHIPGPGNDSGRRNDRAARSSHANALKNVFSVRANAPNIRQEETAILEVLDRYLAYLSGKDFDRDKGGKV